MQEVGPDDYLTKPFAFADLLVRNRALLPRGRVTRASVLRIKVQATLIVRPCRHACACIG